MSYVSSAGSSPRPDINPEELFEKPNASSKLDLISKAAKQALSQEPQPALSTCQSRLNEGLFPPGESITIEASFPCDTASSSSNMYSSSAKESGISFDAIDQQITLPLYINILQSSVKKKTAQLFALFFGDSGSKVVVHGYTHPLQGQVDKAPLNFIKGSLGKKFKKDDLLPLTPIETFHSSLHKTYKLEQIRSSNTIQLLRGIGQSDNLTINKQAFDLVPVQEQLLRINETEKLRIEELPLDVKSFYEWLIDLFQEKKGYNQPKEEILSTILNQECNENNQAIRDFFSLLNIGMWGNCDNFLRIEAWQGITGYQLGKPILFECEVSISENEISCIQKKTFLLKIPAKGFAQEGTEIATITFAWHTTLKNDVIEAKLEIVNFSWKTSSDEEKIEFVKSWCTPIPESPKKSRSSHK